MTSLEFLKPTLAIVLASLLSVRPAQAGYTVTLQQVGFDVVATGSGAIDLKGLTFFSSGSQSPAIKTGGGGQVSAFINTGPISSGVDSYYGIGGPASFGRSSPFAHPASSGSGDMVGIATSLFGDFLHVPKGYVSGNPLSDSAIYIGGTIAGLGVIPGTYVWKWGTGANQNFTLRIKTPLYNAVTGQTAIWYLNNGVFMGSAFAPTVPANWRIVGVADFNGDGKPDYFLYNVSTGQTAVWYLNNNVFIGSAFGPTLPVNWAVVGVADFDGDGRPDYLLFNSTSQQTAIWYLSGTTFVSGTFGPSLPIGWDLVAAGDFNADGKPDYMLYSPATRQTVIWYLNNNAFVSGVFGPTLPVNWRVVGVADFDGDNKPDYLLYSASTRQTVIWSLSGPTFVAGAFGPTIASGYTLIGAADFNTDGKPDYVLYVPSVQ